MIPPKKYNVIIQTFDDILTVVDGDIDQIATSASKNKLLQVNGNYIASNQIKKIYLEQRSYTDKEFAEYQSKLLKSKN